MTAVRLQDPEPRVRVALAECLGALAQRGGPAVYERCGGAIVSTINACFVSDAAPAPPLLRAALGHPLNVARLCSASVRYHICCCKCYCCYTSFQSSILCAEPGCRGTLRRRAGRRSQTTS